MAELTEGQIELARSLHDAGAIKLQQDGEEGFKLKIHATQPDAPLSPIYLNLRVPENKGTLTPEVVERVGTEMHDLIDRDGVAYDVVAGIPKAGVPFADAFVEVSEARGVGDAKITLHKEGEGDARRITGEVDGEYDAGDWALLIDDLITHAGTKVEAVDALRGAGLEVNDLVVLVDREQGGVDEMQKAAVETHAVFTLTQLLDLYLEEERISPEMRRKIDDYLRADAR